VVTVYPTPTAAPPPTGRRERKKLQTRTALEAAALRLFAERGYEQTTVEDIAEAADVAVRTFFRYFSSKQHVLFGDVGNDIAGRLRTALAARPVDEPVVAAVRLALESLDVDDPDQYRQVVERVRLVQQVPEVYPQYEMVFHELHTAIDEFVAARTGLANTSLYPQALAGAAVVSAKAALCLLEGGDVPAAELRAARRRCYEALTGGLEALR
jgi:AcrR family transcriptional regulator